MYWNDGFLPSFPRHRAGGRPPRGRPRRRARWTRYAAADLRSGLGAAGADRAPGRNRRCRLTRVRDAGHLAVPRRIHSWPVPVHGRLQRAAHRLQRGLPVPQRRLAAGQLLPPRPKRCSVAAVRAESAGRGRLPSLGVQQDRARARLGTDSRPCRGLGEPTRVRVLRGDPASATSHAPGGRHTSAERRLVHRSPLQDRSSPCSRGQAQLRALQGRGGSLPLPRRDLGNGVRSVERSSNLQ